MLNDQIKKYIENSVLCWLATSDRDNFPNVSPKEMFTNEGDKILLIAHIASPGSVANIKLNPKVCVSFIDIFVQKGYKIKGTATIIDDSKAQYKEKLALLHHKFGKVYPIKSIINIDIENIKEIKAPSYLFFPNITEQEQVEKTFEVYKSKITPYGI
jgi:uncharacterized protein